MINSVITLLSLEMSQITLLSRMVVAFQSKFDVKLTGVNPKPKMTSIEKLIMYIYPLFSTQIPADRTLSR